jgi:hypothetical protein
MKKKKGLAALTALAFNLCIAFAVAFATGFSVAASAGVGLGLSVLGGLPGGTAGMAIQREIWMNHIVEGLFADNSFLSKAYNADQFVNIGRTVHIPNAGSPSGVVKNRTELPATITTRTDTDLTFDLDTFTTNPIRIDHADQVELSYNKIESILKQDKTQLQEVVAESFLYNWSPLLADSLTTTGESVAAHAGSGTGTRKAFTKQDVLAAMTKLNKDNVPQAGRYLLLDAVMYSQLLESLTANEALAFHAAANVAAGTVGRLFGFDVITRSRALLYTGAGVKKEWTTAGVVTDNAGALAWHVNSVCRALGEVNAYDNIKDPTYYGDIYSFLVRAGGRIIRADKKGVLAIIQDSVS